MKPEIKKLWIDALRSGKYSQTKNRLRDGDCFCAQGVLCDLYSKETNTEWKSERGVRYTILNNAAIIPNSVCDWAGLGLETISLSDAKKFDTVVAMNDRRENSFDEIADFIEQNL